MSAVVKIDGAGNLPTFLDRAQAGLDRMVKSEHNVKGALRGLSEALDSTGNSAQMASQAANVLSEKFVRGLGGAAVVGAVKIVADQISNMAEIIGQVGEKAAKAIDQLQAMSDPSNFQEAVAQSASLKQTMGEINEEILKIEKNPLRNFIAQTTGAKEEMQKLAETMKRVAETNVALGAMRGERRALDTMGMTPEQVKQYDLSQKRNQQIEEASKLSPGLREQAVESLKKTFELEDQNARNQAENKSTMTGEQAAMALGTQFDNNRLDYQRKEADRIAKLQEDRAAQAEEDKKKEEERKNKVSGDYQDMVSQAQGQLIDAAQQRFQAEKNNITAQGNASAIASRLGGSLRGPGQRMSNFEIGANKAVERAFQAAQKKEAGRYKDEVAEDLMLQGKSYDGNAVNRELVNRRKKQAEQEAGGPFDAAKATQSALTDITKYMGDVQNLLNQLTQYAHVT
jgi:hypothetical protein